MTNPFYTKVITALPLQSARSQDVNNEFARVQTAFDLVNASLGGSSAINASNVSLGTLPISVLTGTYNINVTGNAFTATKLQTPRLINGIPFDGTQDITIPGGGGGGGGDATTLNGQPGSYYLNLANSTGSLVASQIADATLTVAKFASGIEPVTIVAGSVVPTVKSTNMIYLVGDGKLYRWNGTAYTAAVPAADIAGQLSDAQIAALAANKLVGQVVASQVADGAITTAKFASSIEPVTVVVGSVLPTVKSTNTIYLTGDGKLYRWIGGAYSAVVATSDLSGTISDAQISGMAASKVTGQLTSAQIADLAATKITGQLSDAQLAAISAAKLTGQITSTQITDGAISTPKLAAGAVTASTLAADSVVAGKIATNAVTSATIAAGAITTAKIAAGAVTAGEIAANAVTSAAINAGAITAGKIAAGAIQASDIAAGTITGDRLAANTITASQIAADTITAGQIAAGAIGVSELAAGAVTTAKLAAGAVTANEIAANAITSGKIAADAITANAILAGSITTPKLAIGAVTANEIAAGAVTADKIAANTITAGQIAAGAIGAAQIAAGAIRTDRLLVTGQGAALNADPNTQDVSAWAGGTLSVVTDTAAPTGRALEITSVGATTAEAAMYALDASRNYQLRIHARQVSGATTCYLGVDFLDASGASILGSANATGWPSAGTYFYFGLAGTQPPASYTQYSIAFGPNETAKIPAAARYVRIIILGNYTGGAGSQRFSAIRLMEKASADLIVDGSIIASKIAANAIAVGSAAIQNGAITNAMLGNAIIDSAKIIDGSVVTAKIGDAQITTAKIASAQITNALIADAAITTAKIADAQITNAKITALDASKITTGTLDAARIAANSITASQIDSRGLSIRDGSGNIILAAGSPLAAGNITPASGWLNSNITVSGGVLSGIGTAGIQVDNAVQQWAQVQNRPREDDFRNNLIDLSFWRKGGALPWAGNFGAGGVGQAFYAYGPSGTSDDGRAIPGPRGGGDVCLYAQEQSSNGDEAGGWNGGTFITPLDPSKTYRFVIPIRRLSGTGTAYWGTGNVCNLNTTSTAAPADNPYFAAWGGLQFDRWYLFVGYVYPYGTTGHTNDSAGIWDCKTGQKVTAGTNWNHAISGASAHRAYQFYASVGAEQLFGRPMVNLVDGTEPSLREYFEQGAVLNSDIGITGSGTITGIGTGAGTTIANNQIGINASGQFYGGGAGTGITVSNAQISINVSGQIGGIGSGTGTVVDNSKVGGDNLIPDPQFLSPSFWLGDWVGDPNITNFNSVNASRWTGNYAGSPGFALQCGAWGSVGDGTGQAIPLQRGRYRLRIRVYKDAAGTSGNFWAGIHVPGQAWWTAPAVNGGQLPTGSIPENGWNLGAIPGNAWTDYTTVLDITGQESYRCQPRIRNGLTAGAIWFTMELARVPSFDGTNEIGGQITAGNASTFIANAAIGTAQIANASIGLAQINTATIGNLAAINAWTGQLTVDSTGHIKGGATSYSAGDGFWIGNDAGTYKFRIGSTAQYVRWTGSALEVKLNTVSLSATTPSGGSFALSSTIVRLLGTSTVTASGGTPPYTYQWSLVNTESEPLNTGFDRKISASGATCSFYAGANHNSVQVVVAQCIVTDSNGLTAFISRTASGTFGTGPP